MPIPSATIRRFVAELARPASARRRGDDGAGVVASEVVVEEAGGGECRIAPVTGERLRSGHTQFANLSGGNQTKLIIDNHMIKS